MKDLKNVLLEKLDVQVNESNLDDILDEVSDWFWSHTGEDDYDNARQRREDLEAMADKMNDPMVDQCMDSLDLSDSEADKYYDDIVDKLAELAAERAEDL